MLKIETSNYKIVGYDISFIGLHQNVNAKETINTFAQFAVDIIEGKIDYTNRNILWKDWKFVNMINEVQALLLFKTVFVQRVLLGCLAWHNDNYVGSPIAR